MARPKINSGTVKNVVFGLTKRMSRWVHSYLAHNSQTERDQSLEMTKFSEHPLHSLTIWRCLEQIWAFEQ